MDHSNRRSLDMEEQSEALEKSGRAANKKAGTYLEIVPLALITAALLLRYLGSEYWLEVLLGGGLLAAVLYLLFSWYLFSIEEYKIWEVVLSVVSGLVFAMGIAGLLARMKSWPGSDWLLEAGLNGGLVLCALSCGLFLFNLSNERAAIFYRNLLARLMIFIAILLSLFMNV